MTKPFAAISALLTLASGCTRNPSVLRDSAGPHAREVAGLFKYFLVVDSIVFVIVIAVLLFGIWRRRVPMLVDPIRPPPETERKLFRRVLAAVGTTALVLTSFVAASYKVDRDLVHLDRDEAVRIEVTAHQWWWELRYLSMNDNPSEIFTTANEIHVPVGEKIRLILKSNDVVHSLWFPNLSGKRDIIPGRDQDLFVRPDREGVWEGRCAEFCGLQHAGMRLKMIAEPRAKYDAWRMAQLLPAADPSGELERRGKQVFQRSACILCHSIRTVTTTSYGDKAPDLTHLKSRTTIGAGVAPNTKGYLGGWILDPHGIKPGVHMPTILQEPADFKALLSYLETLR